MPSLTVALLLLEWLHDGVYVRALKQQTDKHKLVTHNLGDIGKVRVHGVWRAQTHTLVNTKLL